LDWYGFAARINGRDGSLPDSNVFRAPWSEWTIPIANDPRVYILIDVNMSKNLDTAALMACIQRARRPALRQSGTVRTQ